MKPTVEQLRSLIGNPRAYAEQRTDGSWLPIRADFGRQQASEHLCGARTYGTYVLDGDQARTLVFDFDSGVGDKAAVKKVRDALFEVGVDRYCSGVEFSGRKGYHLWLVMEAPVPARVLRRLGRAVLALAEVKCEVFPKQDSATDLGNLVKLPGGIHRVSGKENNFLTKFPELLTKATLRDVLADLPLEPERVSTYEGEELRPCVGAASDGVEEGGRDNALFQLAVFTLKAGLSPEATEAVVDRAAMQCTPPFRDKPASVFVKSAMNSGPICEQLEGRPYHCGESCVLKREGLTCRPGELGFSPPGETVVMEVLEKEGSTVTVGHPDAKSGAMIALRERKQWKS